MSAQLFSRSGARGQQVLAALGEHLPAGLMTRPLVLADDGLVLDEDGASFGVDDEGAWRLVRLPGGGEEATWFRHGREVARRARIAEQQR